MPLKMTQSRLNILILKDIFIQTNEIQTYEIKTNGIRTNVI